MHSSDVEKIVSHQTVRLFIGGGLLIFFGICMAIFEYARITNLVEPILLGRFSTAINVVLLLAFLIPSSRAITKKLIKSKQDEYWYHLDTKSKAKAYSFLSYSVLLVAILLGGAGMFATSMIVVLVGVTWIMVARGGGHVDV